MLSHYQGVYRTWKSLVKLGFQFSKVQAWKSLEKNKIMDKKSGKPGISFQSIPFVKSQLLNI